MHLNRPTLSAVIGLTAVLLAPLSLPAATFTVDSTADQVDFSTSDGVCDTDNSNNDGPCTLRAAIMQSNASGGADTINLPSGTYNLTIASGTSDIDPSVGDLDIGSGGVSILGAGAGTTIVSQSTTHRVFEIPVDIFFFGSVTFQGFTIQGGNSSGLGFFNQGSGIQIGSRFPTLVTLRDMVVTGNNGAAAVSSLADLEIEDCTISTNTGHGVSLTNDDTSLNYLKELNITDSTIDNNTGSGIFIVNAEDGTIINSTISTNGFYGLFAQFTQNDLIVTNTTINGNASNGIAGLGYYIFSSFASPSIVVRNSIVSNNTAGDILNPTMDANAVLPTSQGYNIISDSTGAAAFTATGDANATDPLLQALALNAPGATRTHTLGIGSPAIDAASASFAPPADQRGVVRPQGSGDDMGAVEIEPPPLYPDLALTKDDGGANPAPGDTVVYTLSFANNGDQGADGVVLSDTVPANTVFDPASSSPGWVCTPDNQAGSACTYAAGSLSGGGATGVADFAVIIDNPTPPGVNHISNTASITDDGLNGSDLNPSDNTDTVVTLFETTPPTVDNVDTDADTGDGTLEDCESADGISVVRLMVTFSEPVRDPPGDTDPDDVTNPANYRVVGAGIDFELDTSACGAVLGDDVEATITSISYATLTNTATIQLDAALEPSVYRLLVCGSTSILDLAGNPLDGNANGTGGDDFALTFRAEPTNLFTNGHLDCGLGAWTISETIPSSVIDSTVDADDSTLSGSASISNTSATGVTESFSLDQCVVVGAARLHNIGRVVRLDADPGITLTVSTDCEYFDTPDCGGAGLGLTEHDTALQDTSGLWQSVQHPAPSPAGAVSAMCRSILETADGSVFDAWFDQLLMTDTPVIFADGFESGNANAWSSLAP